MRSGADHGDDYQLSHLQVCAYTEPDGFYDPEGLHFEERRFRPSILIYLNWAYIDGVLGFWGSA
jgi:hypothetical protein